MTKQNIQTVALVADKEHLRRRMQVIRQQLGIEHDPTATAEKAREMILADGVKPEDNVFSCGIISAREAE